MITTFIVILVLVAVALVWLATQSGEYHVHRKHIIKASPEALFETESERNRSHHPSGYSFEVK